MRNAETLLSTLAEAIECYGLPQRITLDRDPRSVGAPAGSDFPSALLRFGAALGIEMNVCPPHHPQDNGFVERYHRSYQEECLSRDRPRTLEEARSVTEQFVEHYNHERPNQALSCGNRPPRTAFPALPILPRPPKQIEADAWLKRLDGVHLERHPWTLMALSRSICAAITSMFIEQANASRSKSRQRANPCGFGKTGLCSRPYAYEGSSRPRSPLNTTPSPMIKQARTLNRLRSLQERRTRKA